MTSGQSWAEVIGDPIGHSKSPLIHRHWLDQLGLPGDYRATRVTADDLPRFLASRQADRDWRGCNVTLPHKAAVTALVRDPGDVSASIGAMNVLYRDDDGVLCGTNSDAAGFFAPLADVPLAGAHVVLIGAGGAARAVLFALGRLGVGQVTLINRNVLKAAGLLAHFGVKGHALPLDPDRPHRLPPADLLVNSSSLGMAGQPPLRVDLSACPASMIVYDLVYEPFETPLLAVARAADMPVISGIEMLIGQAAVAFELFFGAPPPDDDDLVLLKKLTACAV